MDKKQRHTSASKRKSKDSYVIVYRDKVGRITLSKRQASDAELASDDAVRFSNVEFRPLKSKPDKKTETVLRKAVREAMKQKPLGKF